MNQKTDPGILFRIDPENSVRLREWVYETDWQIIASQIDRRGAAIVLDQQPEEGQFSLGTIREIPSQRGRFRPHYGDFGGGFEYRFRPQPHGVSLIVSCLAKNADGGVLPTLELHLPGTVEFQVDHLYNTGLVYVDGSRFTSGENHFGFYGEFFEIYRNWKCYREGAVGFEFRFYPLSVGCMMRILHLKTESLLDLTKDVHW